MKNITDRFFNMFPKIILGNEIVASILDVVGRKLDILKEDIDETLNTDL